MEGSEQVDTPASIFERARALSEFGRNDEAIAELRRGLASFPEDPWLLGELAWRMLHLPDHAEAERLARQTLAARPDDEVALMVLCETSVASKRFDVAQQLARELVGHHPEWATSHLNLAFALVSDDRGTRAERKARNTAAAQSVGEALLLDPEGNDTLFRSTVLFRRANKPAEAQRTLDRALELDPTSERLRLLVADSTETNEAEALRLLSGVLAENPQHRGASRSVSDRIWSHTQHIATFAVWGCVAVILFANFAFGESIADLASPTRRQFTLLLLALSFGWIGFVVLLNRGGLPKRFIRRLFGGAWWVWIGLIIAITGSFLASILLGGLAARSQSSLPTVMGEYVGDVTMMVGFVAWYLMIGELAIVLARFHSEARTGLFPPDAEGLQAARAALRHSYWGLVPIAIAALVAALPFLPITSRNPEAAGGLFPVALAVAAPPLVTILLRALRVRNLGGSGPLRVTLIGLGIAVLFVIGGWALADRHAAEYDPPQLGTSRTYPGT
ncbi:tetratricopeptide repeat protein [Leucobacter denitrificans]|uniref:Uncharacterized protein n=1 Tax=Leucobacter denitrificans TaxID=683042 RepID=A0A7G9S2Y8_9MICO|nr:tetratricopeptide repeat protein [Leucobacter denitrificans]QNN62213.1 hypothetical protein H9L06_07935 [Leucobacter denitrificans]